MKKIGLIGGMSWESSLVYYKILNETAKSLLGGFHSSRCVLESVDFAEIEKLQHENDWESLKDMMIQAAKNLEHAKADVIVLCTNTMHLCSDAIINSTSVPFLHIAEATGKKIKDANLEKVLLLGTKFTMEKDFLRNKLQNDFGIHVVVPNAKNRELVHSVIYNELVQGIIKQDSKNAFKTIISESVKKGVQGVILGCTEIPMLIQSKDVSIPVFDTTRIHAEYAVEFALND